MRLRCMSCGKSVSNEVSDDTVVRAALECPECIESRTDEPIRKITINKESMGEILYTVGERSGMSPVEYATALMSAAFALGHTFSPVEKASFMILVDKIREQLMLYSNIIEDKKGTIQ